MTTSRKSPVIGACPECDANIAFTKAPFLGQTKTCPECLAELEVIGLSPIELDWAYEYDDYADDDMEFSDDDY
jgi:lysine biosynthesis protein LysW